MSYVKYNKTSTFLFPLLNIPKGLFYCNVKNSFGNTIMTTRFVNSFVKDSDLGVEKYNKGPYIFIVIKGYQDIDFETFYSTILSYPNYVDEYQKLEFLVMIFKVPDENISDYNKVVTGKYSEISAIGKNLIMGNSYFSGKATTIPLILHKAKSLRDSWEERLSSKDHFVDLADQEVWPIITDQSKIKNEILDLKKMKEISKTYTALEIRTEEQEESLNNLDI
jgi:hypothetical protein